MINFKLIKKNVSIEPLLNEISSHPDLWNLNKGRQDKIKVQREAESIPIRGIVKSKFNGRKRWDVHESRFTNNSKAFPIARKYIQQFSEDMQAELGRAKIVKLKPDHRVYEHIDRGEYYKIRDRYHLVLQTAPGNYLQAGDEVLEMAVGELWWFDNKQPHSAYNGSTSERIHFIFDLLKV